MKSKERVIRSFEFRSPDKVPRHTNILPWARIHHPKDVNKLEQMYPTDTAVSPQFLKKDTISTGNQHEVGLYVDDWGCKFLNLIRGIHGEVKEPIVIQDDWSDAHNIHIPEEWLSVDTDKVNEFYASTDKLVSAACFPRPFEQLQFIRGTENLYMDLIYKPKKMMEFIEKMHDLYCRQITLWAQTDIDKINFMDDWGSQLALLINPKIWQEIFKPMYKDYIDIAHKYGKKAYMHSDGYILEILPHLVDLGLDAVNAQLFCMPMDKLKQYKGKITFWGEIDRQNMLPYASVEEIKNAVRFIFDNLWDDGGCVAMCNFGSVAKPENVFAVYETWDELL